MGMTGKHGQQRQNYMQPAKLLTWKYLLEGNLNKIGIGTDTQEDWNVTTREAL